MERIPDAALEIAIAGRNLRGATLAAEIGTAETLLVFLRHLG